MVSIFLKNKSKYIFSLFEKTILHVYQAACVETGFN